MTSDLDDNGSTSRRHQGEIVLIEERCKGCSFCVVFCPNNALSMGARLNIKGYHLPEMTNPRKCNGCDRCGLYCPDFAIFGVRSGSSEEKDA